LVPGLSRGCC